MCGKMRYAPIIPLLTIPFITICGLKILHFVSALTSAEKGRVGLLGGFFWHFYIYTVVDGN